MSNNAQIINIGAIHVADGTTVDFVPEADVPAGSIVVVGKLVGIAKFGISAGSRGSITVRGVFDVAELSTRSVTVKRFVSQKAVKRSPKTRLISVRIRRRVTTRPKPRRMTKRNSLRVKSSARRIV